MDFEDEIMHRRLVISMRTKILALLKEAIRTQGIILIVDPSSQLPEGDFEAEGFVEATTVSVVPLEHAAAMACLTSQYGARLADILLGIPASGEPRIMTLAQRSVGMLTLKDLPMMSAGQA